MKITIDTNIIKIGDTIYNNILISYLKIQNIQHIKNMFYECSSLNTLPDIFNWNNINAMDMSNIFYECTSLTKLPDISSLNTSNTNI